LKENFDRFNFAIHKEKEMADFRRLLTVLALVALFVGLASAQGGINGGASSMSCSTTTTVTPTVRSEGLTELVGDIVLSCSGGNALVNGTQIPQANITVFLNTQVTSRILANSSSTNNQSVSEALLLIDEPGSTTVSGYGPSLPQSVCATPATGCVAFVGNVSTPAVGIGVPVTSQGGTAFAPNVFQGIVSGNSVTFYGVPILPPATTGSRIFRITNVRANASGISGGGPTPGTITGSISISPSNAFTINQPLNTLAFVQTGLTSSLRSSGNGGFPGGGNQFQQCVTNGLNGTSPGGNNGNGVLTTFLRFSEGFATSFKPRSATGPGITNTNSTASVTTQNIPGTIYNSESGFTLVTPANASVVAGLADFGTRLKAVFSNIPSGVSIFVSTTNFNAGTTTGATSANNTAFAQLVISETVPDANGQLAFASSTFTQGGVGYAPVSLVNGSGVAVWEVTGQNPSQIENFDFGVNVNYSANPGTNSPLPGNLTVSQSLAPNPTNGAFTATAGASASSTLPIPRFIDTGTGRTFASVSICQTVLLFPYVSTITGFETGLAIANTSQDPLGTTPQSGSCTLSWYTAGATGTNPAATTTPSIPGGTVYTTLASATTNAGQGFTGYMFAVCNFQYAHGYAALTDLGARGVFSSYLALVVSGSRGVNGESLGN
jgi:hypothetical protein